MLAPPGGFWAAAGVAPRPRMKRQRPLAEVAAAERVWNVGDGMLIARKGEERALRHASSPTGESTMARVHAECQTLRCARGLRHAERA